jgi:hypothetical protein
MKRNARTAGWVLGVSFALVALALVPANAAPTTTGCTSTRQLLFNPIPDQGSTTAPGNTTTVVVRAAKANGGTDTNCTDTISLTIANDPGKLDAGLSCAEPQCSTPAVRGVATFTASLSEAGTGYTLEACSPTTNGSCPPASAGPHFFSGLFAVYNASTPCRNNQTCSASASVAQQVSTTVSANGQAGTSTRAGIFAVEQVVPGGPGELSELDCPGYDEITEVISSFDFNGSGLKTIVDVISAEQMKEIANQGVSFLQACFGSSLPFTDRSGNPAVFNSTLGLFVGLVPDCPPNKKNLAAFAPCVVSRQGGGNGTGLFTMVAADGDPGGKRH